ncbi:efflux RND transporter permease subunit [Methyloversatilis sp.]|uniref:efflux RND transporter permease subunit n=1 Tax=Methyloversatilis sp. TaxID=2569862 RepID=UPI002733BA77|nr:efflux RND transporter permease subunit [Methyloversatilis sp.]MDP2870198.1 efflux RND transporter permease subunit [Methyloversatilis sp.]MDP3454836.1 efflux RND transporter permease subunit [Methyloversatilis sp.]MDP3577006.1 efflux RND transporter permease subunit [Methyloversatilis sp.]
MIEAIVRFSVRRPGIVLALSLVLVLYAISRMFDARLDVFPEFAPAQVVIQTEAPGLPADLVETRVTTPIESAVSGTRGIKELRSQSIPGLSVITVIFEEKSDLFRNRQLVSERLGTLGSLLPAGVTPVITPLTSSASTLLGIGITSAQRSQMDMRYLVDSVVRPHLLAVPGVADVNVFGGEVKQWQIQLDPARLRTLGVTFADVELAARGAASVAGAGFVENDNQRLLIAIDATPSSARSLEQLTVTLPDGRSLALGDVGRVREAPGPAISAAQINGTPGVFMMVQGQLGADTLGVTLELEKSLAELAPLFEREQVTLHPALFRPANFIQTALGNVRADVMIGATLVVIVLFVFLYNLRTAFISAVAIPLSLLAAVLVMLEAGASLNIMVLGGLAIALGEVVDDAIIDCENIYRRLRENRHLGSPVAAWKVVLDASMEVRSSVVYATFIVALVFVPLLTLSGVAGKLFAPLGLAYILAILASLVVALTVTPAMSFLMLGNRELPDEDPPLVRWLRPRYERTLRAIERRPHGLIAGVMLALAGGLGVLPLFGGEFIPPLREGHYIVHLSTIPGTAPGEVLRVGQRVTEKILQIDGVKSVAQWVGRAQNGFDPFGPHYSEVEIEIGPLDGATQERILADIRRTVTGDDGDDDRSDEEAAESVGFPGLAFSVNTFLTERIGETESGFPATLVVQVFGTNLDRLDADASAVARALAKVKGATDVQVLAPPGTPEIIVRPRLDKLAVWRLTPEDVLSATSTAFAGRKVSEVYRGTLATPLVVTLDPDHRRSPNEIGRLPLRTPDGRLVELRDVADISVENGRYKILHSGGKRVQTITANLASGHDLGAFSEAVERTLRDDVKLNAGSYYTVTGAAEAQAQARRELVTHSALAAAAIAILLMLAFSSSRNLVITFVNLPFALIGGVLAALAGGGWLSLGSVVGFVTLFGITLRNSIMLVSHFQHLVEREGHPWNLDTAILGASQRLPSILMTALVTGLGLMPLVLGSGEPGREIEGPMAAIIVGGLTTSTILNLLVLPTLLLHYGRFAKAPQDG